MFFQFDYGPIARCHRAAEGTSSQRDRTNLHLVPNRRQGVERDPRRPGSGQLVEQEKDLDLSAHEFNPGEWLERQTIRGSGAWHVTGSP
jgi:hypothetical protein